VDLGAVMQAIGDRLDTVSGLRVFAYPPGSVTPPAAIVSFPASVTFDATYDRGMDELSLPVVVVVGRPTERSTRDLLAVYCDGSGASSVKYVLESGTYQAFETVRVTGIEFDVVAIGGVDYMAAVFDLNIEGRGA
jgi:hypothetical protein